MAERALAGRAMAERAMAERASAGRASAGWAARVAARVSVPDSARMRLLGTRLAGKLAAGDLVVLAGPLGAGKTTLAAGIGAGLRVRGPVTSPTFVIARLHPSLHGGLGLVHADAYRLGSRLEVDDLDLDADVDSCVTVVEWGEGLVEDLASAYLLIRIGWADSDPTADPDAERAPQPTPAGDWPGAEPRLVTMAGYGDRWERVADQLRAMLAEPLR